MAEDVLAMREFRFAPPERGECDVLVIAGEHSGDEQSARMLKTHWKRSPICACAPSEEFASSGPERSYCST